MATPPKLSSVWFLPKERSLSTSIGLVANNTGTALGFLLVKKSRRRSERTKFFLLSRFTCVNHNTFTLPFVVSAFSFISKLVLQDYSFFLCYCLCLMPLLLQLLWQLIETQHICQSGKKWKEFWGFHPLYFWWFVQERHLVSNLLMFTFPSVLFSFRFSSFFLIWFGSRCGSKF